jgi:tetratricopeptide (TPR) repeat protein
MGGAARERFVGREQELAVLCAALAAATGGQGRIVLLVGEPGIGKTRTMDEVARQAGAQGAEVLFGRCYEGDGAPPFWPWRQALRDYAAARDEATLRYELADGAADVAAICPELGALLPDAGSRLAMEPGYARFRLFDGITRVLARAALRRPLVLVLDDLHGADEPSLLLLQFLAREIRSARLLVVGALRDVALVGEHPLARMFAEVMREPASKQLVLRGFDEGEVAEVVVSVMGSAPPAGLVAAICARTEGHPLYVVEVARELAATGRFEVPVTVRATIARRLAVLSPECRQLLMLGALFGREFHAGVLARASGDPVDAVVAILDEALAARIVEPISDVHGCYRFAHALFGETLVNGLSAGRRMSLHRCIAEALAASSPGGERAAEVAYHYHAAGPGGVPTAAIEWARRAGARAFAQLAYEEAARLYRLALEAVDWPGGGDDTTRAHVLLGLGDAWKSAGQLEVAKGWFARAAEVGRRLGSAELLTRAALGFSPPFFYAEMSAPDHDVARLLEEAIRAWRGRDSGLHARALARLAQTLYFSVAPQQRQEWLDAALAMAHRIDDETTLRHVLAEWLLDPWDGLRLAERFDAADELLRLAEAAGDRESLAMGYLTLACLLIQRGDTARLDRTLAALVPVVEQLGQPYWRWRMALVRGARAFLSGRFDEADAIVEEGARIGQDVAPFGAPAYLAGFRLIVGGFQGRREEPPGYRAIAAAHPVDDAWTPIAWAETQLGNRVEAEQIFRRLARDDFAELRRDSLLLIACCFLAETCSFVGDRARAGWLYRTLEPYAGQWVTWTDVLTLGPIAHFLGLLARTMGRIDDAGRHFENAIASAMRASAPPYLARTQLEYAVLLLERDARGDAERARGLLAQARATAETLGMESVGPRAVALLGDQGTHAELAVAVPPDANVFRRNGDHWTVTYAGRTVRLRDMRGLQLLGQLLRHPAREIHVSALLHAHPAGPTHELPTGGNGYDRLEDLEDGLAEAERFHDLGRSALLRDELHALRAQMASSARSSRANIERTRLAVTKAIKVALARISEAYPALGDHLNATVKRGYFCAYVPDPRHPIEWQD